MKKLLMGVVFLHLAFVPCFADVIPTRRVEKDSASEQKIKARLETLGMPSADADRHVSDLSPQEANYFAQDTNRVQYAAGLYWYEWVGGLLMIGIITLIVIVRLNNN
jgi:hypothetical protein